MRKSVRNALAGFVGTSVGLYLMAVPLTMTAFASTPYGYYNYGGTTVNAANSNSQDPVEVVKASSRSLGFNATTDNFTLVSQSTTAAVVNVIHNGNSYNVNLRSRRGNGSWKITSVNAIKNSGSKSATTNTNSGSLIGINNSGTSTEANSTGSTTTSSGNGSTNVSTGASSVNVAQAEQQAVSLLNADRRANGLPDLQVDSRVTTIAQNYAQDMVNRNYFSHYSPEGQSPFDRLKQGGISYSAAGENIGMNQSVQNAEVAFMNSSGHRANILNSTFTKVGIGVAYDKNGNIYIVQDFIKP